MQRALVTGLSIALAITVACQGPASNPDGSGGAGAKQLTPAERARAQAELEPFESSFQSVEAALRARDDALARRILDRILARDPQGAALGRARAFERILEGREWVSQLSLQLYATRVEPGDDWIVRVSATLRGDVELTLRGAPPALRLVLIGVSPDGLEQRFSQVTPVDALAVWRLPPGVASPVQVGRFSIPIGGALAVRAIFSLEFLPGEVVRDGEVRPATNVGPARTEVIRLADFLPKPPVDAAELARYVREEMIRTAPLLERAVRIPLAERGRALDLLTPAVLELPSGELEKVTVALRWLSGQSDLGADARSWRQWLSERSDCASRNCARDPGPSPR